MHEMDELLNVVDKLLSPEGCPWDRVQTLSSIRHSLLEETCETIDAIDSGDSAHIREELGDVFFNVVFLCRLAEKEGHCTLGDVIKELTGKLVSRHPHVFGASSASSWDELAEQWEKIKSQEKGKDQRKSVLEGIPKSLPALARAQKILKKLKKVGVDQDLNENPTTNEDQIGEELLEIVLKANEQEVEAELALRKIIEKIERKYEK
ncbi:MAG: MazG family protein [Parachlamydiaceae bacterium]